MIPDFPHFANDWLPFLMLYSQGALWVLLAQARRLGRPWR